MTQLKGNAIVGQSGGCTPVINCSLAGIIDAASKHSCIKNLYGMWNGVVGLLNEDFTDLYKQDRDIVKKLYNTPSAALGSCRYKMNDDDTQKVIKILDKHDIHFVYLIGGNDTADSTLKITQCAETAGYPLRVIAVPKTIDNDLPFTDHCPGYGSCARFIAQTVQEAGRDTQAMKLVDPFKIIEVMGRNSGWLVAAAALGKRYDEDAPHLMYFPERAFSMQQFIADVKDVYYKVGYVVIVVSETIRDAEGVRIGAKSDGILHDSFGHVYCEGAAQTLARAIEREFKQRARYDKPGTIQRMSMAYISPVDQKEAYEVGRAAVDISIEGKSGVMVTIQRRDHGAYAVDYGDVPVEQIAGVEHYLPEHFINVRGNFVTQDFIEYARPLIGDPLPEFARIM
ncbi:MAG: 6-phosphofructokinase [Candidatus Omnitrophica bacterium]|nr:6-phosphofructokinase [Candidatus Omnitrophota bacterium]